MTHHTGSVPESERAVDWRDHGLCGRRGENAEDWFPVGSGHDAIAAENHAKAVCWRCPSMEACGQWALENREPIGVWGGMSERERRAILRRRGINLLTLDDDSPTPERTFHTIWNAHAAATGDGHCDWRGSRPISYRGQHFTPQQIGFIVSRGRPPVGPVLPTCTRTGCILPAHVADQQEREQRSQVKAVAS